MTYLPLSPSKLFTKQKKNAQQYRSHVYPQAVTGIDETVNRDSHRERFDEAAHLLFIHGNFKSRVLLEL